VVFSLCVLGFYFFPFSLDGLTQRLRLRVFVTTLALLLFFSCMPRLIFGGGANPDVFGGNLRSLLLATTSATGPLRVIILGVLLVIGCQVLFNCCWPIAGESLPIRALQISCVLGIVMQAMRGEVMYERYLLLLLGFLYMLVLHRNHRHALWYVWFAVMIILQFIHLHQHHVI
jgi:hypothetical protein